MSAEGLILALVRELGGVVRIPKEEVDEACAHVRSVPAVVEVDVRDGVVTVRDEYLKRTRPRRRRRRW